MIEIFEGCWKFLNETEWKNENRENLFGRGLDLSKSEVWFYFFWPLSRSEIPIASFSAWTKLSDQLMTHLTYDDL